MLQDTDAVIRTIHPNDWMLSPGREGEYFRFGGTGAQCVHRALNCVALSFEVKTGAILDLPSGYGRVLRFLKATYPEASITACDIVEEAVDFCVETFGARGVYSADDPREIDDDWRYDAIWCGSLLTHLREEMWDPWLAFFEERLAPGGSLLFSTHGEAYARGYFPDHMPAEFHKLQAAYRETGFAFSPFKAEEPTGNGTSLSSPAWVLDRLRRRPFFRVTSFMERAWLDAHDVWCVTREPQDRIEADETRAASIATRLNGAEQPTVA